MAVVKQGQVNKFKINLWFMFRFWWNKTKLLFGNKISCVDRFIPIKLISFLVGDHRSQTKKAVEKIMLSF